MDVHVPAAITRALRRLGVDVLTAQEDDRSRMEDHELLDRAGTLGRIVFTRDSDFLAEAVRRQRIRLAFATVVYAHQQRVSIGQCVLDIELIARASRPEEATGQIVYLPL
jgi:predicted nuclease of predicted toxin-antitoxin system